jgi:enoyl-CoA hydratase
MTTACDMRYCTEDAYFVVKEIDLGMTADVGTLQRLPRVIPNGLARELAYTGREMRAEEALRSGFVNAVYRDQETMLEEVFAIAKRIAGHSPLAIAGSKEMINYVEDHSIADGLNYIATWQAGMFAGTRDLMEAFQAGQEKRAPSFEDLAPSTDMRPYRAAKAGKQAAE